MALSATQALITEQAKENFFQYLTKDEEGRNFLSTVAERIMDRTQHYLLFSYAYTKENILKSSVGDWLQCQTCKASVMALDGGMRTKVVTKSLEEFGVLVCNQIETANNTVCPGAVGEMGDIIVPVLANFLLSPDYVCSRILSMCDPVFKELDQNTFVNRVMAEKPDHLKTNDFVDKLYEGLKAEKAKGGAPRKTFKAAHFSDVHVDLYYKPGTNKNCNMPLCCREENGYPANPEDAAGIWGEYNCDTSPAALTKMFEFLRDEVKPDVLFWTGDMSAHSVWENSVEEVSDVNNVVMRQIQDMFGEKLMVFPLQGNHDVWPVNVQSFNEPNEIVQNLTHVWNYWLNDNAIKTFSKAGYYYQYFELKSDANRRFFNDTRVLGVTT